MTLFASDRVQEAFQTMQQSHHIGKLVVTYEANASTAAEKPAADCAVEGTVVVTGGLGGLGRKVAERMVEREAKALVLLSPPALLRKTLKLLCDGLKIRALKW